MPGATRSIVINVPPEKLFDVITDYSKYPEFLPEVKAIRTTGSSPKVDVHYEIELMKRIKYTVRMVEERPKKVSWTFVEGEMMKDNKGSWVLEPAGEGKTNATYNLELGLGPFVPKSIVDKLAETSLPKMLEAFKKRAEQG